MTPEEARRLRKEKILKRQALTEQEIANSLINNNIQEMIKKSENLEIQKSVEDTKKPELNLNYFKIKERKTNFKKFKVVLFMLLGVLTSFFTFLYKIEQHPNIFLLFFLIDISLNFFLFKDKVEIDKDIYSNRVGGFIKVVEKMGLFFEIIDDLACYFIPFIVMSCLIHYLKLN